MGVHKSMHLLLFPLLGLIKVISGRDVPNFRRRVVGSKDYAIATRQTLMLVKPLAMTGNEDRTAFEVAGCWVSLVLPGSIPYSTFRSVVSLPKLRVTLDNRWRLYCYLFGRWLLGR